MKCVYCYKECKNANSKRNHERLCKLNENRQILKSNFIQYNQRKKELGIASTNQYIKAKSLGLPQPQLSDETKKKLADYAKARKFTPEARARHSVIMKKAVEKNPDSYSKKNVSGRVKSIQYKEFTLKGSWEYLVAQWLDTNCINWEYEVGCFDYEWNGMRKYFPDFYLPEYDIFLEVKGYETDRDSEKWKILKNLIVIKQKEIKEIKNNTFNLLNHINILNPTTYRFKSSTDY